MYTRCAKLDDIFTPACSPDFHQLFGAQMPPPHRHIFPVHEQAVAVLNKKDSLYRPLMRQFRRYFRKDALSQGEYARIHAFPIAQQGPLFADALMVPDALRSQPRTPHAVLLLIDSHRIYIKKQLVPICQETMGPHVNDIWIPFFRVFNECNRRHRKIFFSDPLVQFLWAIFRVDCSEQILAHLARVKGDCKGGSQALE